MAKNIEFLRFIFAHKADSEGSKRYEQDCEMRG